MKRLIVLAALALTACSSQTAEQRVSWDSMTYTQHTASKAAYGSSILSMSK